MVWVWNNLKPWVESLSGVHLSTVGPHVDFSFLSFSSRSFLHLPLPLLCFCFLKVSISPSWIYLLYSYCLKKNTYLNFYPTCPLNYNIGTYLSYFNWLASRGEVKITQSCWILCNPMDYTFHEILQARILEWVAFPFSRGSSQPRDWSQVSCIAGGFFTSWATREAQEYWSGEQRTWLHTRPEKIKSQIQFPIISVKNWSIDLVTILILIRQRERCWFPYRSLLKIKWPGVHIKYNFIPLINCMD